MKLLMHICCAPCTIYPLRILKSDGHELCGFFYNPNIHPYLEYKKRLDNLKTYTLQEKLSLSYSEEYPMEEFLRSVAFREMDRCRYCYYDRLVNTARLARSQKYDGFTSTLLYSKYQDHEMIKGIGENLANEYGIPFYYHDFREGWAEGVKMSKEAGMYRQSYCGCIYSEKERFYAGQ
ncbi:MAG: epoxyqueuosine reductase QueH [Deltaproteobacteria bacterium]|jgi:predicted adenine nucleotide alpha hydrolase (AANH) superfamily ATPase